MGPELVRDFSSFASIAVRLRATTVSRMRTRLQVALAVVAATTLVFSAAPAAQAAVTWGSIEGTIVDETGAPRSGATVTASGPTTIFLHTDPDGSFHTQAIAGDYLVYFGVPDFTARDMVGGYGSPQKVTVVTGQVTVIDEVLRTGGTISGRILDIHGKPLAGAQITADDPSLYRNELYASDASAITNAKGQYTLTGLVTGAFRIRISKPGYFTEWYGNSRTEDDAKRVRISEGHATGGLTSHLSRGGTVSGRLVINGKKPKGVPGARFVVTLSSSDGTWIDSESSKKKFSFSPGAAGRYVIRYCAGPSEDKMTCKKKVVKIKRGKSATGLVLTLKVPSLKK